jgi:hypothetical protein
MLRRDRLDLGARGRGEKSRNFDHEKVRKERQSLRTYLASENQPRYLLPKVCDLYTDLLSLRSGNEMLSQLMHDRKILCYRIHSISKPWLT